MGQVKHKREQAKNRRRQAGRISVVLFAVVLATAGAILTTSSSVSADRPAPAPQPPTRTPDAPAIVVAGSADQDLPGGWLLSSQGQYLLFVSTSFGDPRDNIPMLTGSPGHWSAAVDAFPTLPAWAVPVSKGGLTWQPEVHRFGATYVLYYSAQLAGVTPGTHCLGTAVATSAAGPYSPSPQPIVCQRDQGGDIDPQVVVDDTSAQGRPYLVWKSDNNSTDHTGTDLLWSQPLASDGRAVVGSPTSIFGLIQAPAWAHPIIEAPQMVEAPNRTWWLFYSGGDGFYGSNYAVGVAKCEGISGPCTGVGVPPLIGSNAQGVGPGEETIFQANGSSAGASTWVLYNPWHANDPFHWFRPVAAARIGWSPAGPYIAEAGTFPAPSGA
ncbi:MAG TPA: glycoside hydrolase family 43 protein [Acidimicrobiales bacterium]|jgi:hypothetical protein|nr:glycoside hydrolase family 43 protein [Acidimicrobiales bacterium]